MNTFKPTLKWRVKKTFNDALLDGNIIRYDGYHTKVEVLPRTLLSVVEQSDNLFQRTGTLCSYYKSAGYTENSIEIPRELIKECMEELSQDYIMHKVHCSGSGCAQYATYAIYLV